MTAGTGTESTTVLAPNSTVTDAVTQPNGLTSSMPAVNGTNTEVASRIANDGVSGVPLADFSTPSNNSTMSSTLIPLFHDANKMSNETVPVTNETMLVSQTANTSLNSMPSVPLAPLPPNESHSSHSSQLTGQSAASKSSIFNIFVLSSTAIPIVLAKLLI